MTRNIKKWLFALTGAFFITTAALADNDKPITISQLPAAAQTVVKTYFKNKKVALAKQENDTFSKTYEVIFTDGDKIEFAKNGQWTDIECSKAVFPASLVPAPIKAYVKSNYAGSKIVKIERDKKEYDVKLSSGLEITFDKKFRVIDIDD